MNITLVNDDPFGNNVRVVDANAGDNQIFNNFIPAHGEQPLVCRENDAGYGNIATYQDGGPRINRSFLKEGERISL